MQLHVETLGAGPPLVLLHGWALNLRVFDALARELAASHRVIAVDLPGHGCSPWDDGADIQARVDAVLEVLPARATVLGWSLGGQYALRLAARAAERVERLALIATSPRFVAAPDWPHGLAPAVLERFAAQLSADLDGTVRDFLELAVRGSAAAPATLAALRAALSTHGTATPPALAAGLAQLAGDDLREPARRIAQPALVIAGQYDRVTPPGAAAVLTTLLPHATHVELRRAGHAPFLSHATECLAALRAFLAAGAAHGSAGGAAA